MTTLEGFFYGLPAQHARRIEVAGLFTGVKVPLAHLFTSAVASHETYVSLAHYKLGVVTAR